MKGLYLVVTVAALVVACSAEMGAVSNRFIGKLFSKRIRKLKKKLNEKDIEIKKLKRLLSSPGRLSYQKESYKIIQDKVDEVCKPWGKFEKMCKPAVAYAISNTKSQRFSFECPSSKAGETTKCDLIILFMKYDGSKKKKNNFYFKFTGKGCEGNERKREAVLSQCTVSENKLISFASACKEFPGVKSCSSPDYRMRQLETKTGRRRLLSTEGSGSAATES
jgi:hypothetical protein